MKTTNLILALVAMAVIACQPTKQTEEETKEESGFVSLIKLWETDTTLLTPESVIYDEFRDVLYVANIGNTPHDTLDFDGFISIVSTDGKILNRDWVSGGISSMKGMGIVDSSLFVTDIAAVIEIDIPSGQIINTFEVEGAGFLNDITVDADKSVYISDSKLNNIHVIKNGELSLWHNDSTFNGSNGLLSVGDKMMVAGFGSGNLFELNTADMTSSVVADSIFQGDGINKIDDGFLISCWRGVIFHVKPDGSKEVVLDTQKVNRQSADAWYEPNSQTLYVPTFFGNSVAAYQVK